MNSPQGSNGTTQLRIDNDYLEDMTGKKVVVVGGGVTGSGEPLRAEIEAAMRKYLLPVIADRTELTFAKHGNDAGMLGAFYHFRQTRGEF